MIQLPRTGGPRRCVYGPTEDKCIENYNRAIGAGTVRVRPGSISEFVAIHFTSWIESRVQAGSLSRYDAAWRHHLGPEFGALRFSELTIQGIQDGLMRRDLSPSSLEMSKGLLLQIIKLAVAMGHTSPETITMASLAKLPQVRSRQRVDVSILSASILRRALEAGHWVAGPIYASVTLGLRKGEICGLKITDLQDGVLLLQRQRNHTEGEKPRLKHRGSGDVRRIGLPPSIIERLHSFWNGQSTYLFTRDDGKPVDYNHLSRYMDLFQGSPRIRFHDLRSAAIVNLIEAGVSDHTIMDLVGHSAADMIRIYRDQSDKRTRDALEKVTDVH